LLFAPRCALEYQSACDQPDDFEQRRLRFEVHAAFQFFHEWLAAARTAWLTNFLSDVFCLT
jgi:hypothetical protein